MKLYSAIIFSFLLTVKGLAHQGLPANYQALSGCQKQDFLWENVEKTQHTSLPEFEKFGAIQLLGMTVQQLTKKKALDSDVAPKKWKKFLHRRGSVAKVKIIATENHPYTGVFSGADCALLRLSITYRPTKERNFAPGLALKVLRDGAPSANVSALYLLEGQENYNFFENPLSNIVPIGRGIGLKLVHGIFKRVTDYPEELGLNHFSNINSTGKKVTSAKAPKHIFFVPNPTLKVSRGKHDVREDFQKIPEGTLLYSVYAVTDKHSKFNYYDYEKENISSFLKDSIKIADIYSTSSFISSEFGDTGIFFRHEVRPKK
ncbi:MAG: hypothetical protein K9K67_12330 [Bacteriovoracaceae bacterium]|nr:hypothetical protein [Bacteriovoracaceae bacterium]